MTRKCQSHTMKSNPQHHKEEAKIIKSTCYQEDKNSKATSSFFPSMMTEKLERVVKYVITKQELNTEPPQTNEATINNESATREPPP